MKLPQPSELERFDVNTHESSLTNKLEEPHSNPFGDMLESALLHGDLNLDQIKSTTARLEKLSFDSVNMDSSGLPIPKYPPNLNPLHPVSPHPAVMAPTIPLINAEEARKKHLEEKMPVVQAAARRLQSALEIYDADPWPNPPISSISKSGICLVKMNGVRVRAALRMCENFAVDKNRYSENADFIDERISHLRNEKMNKGLDKRPWSKIKIASQERNDEFIATRDMVMIDTSEHRNQGKGSELVDEKALEDSEDIDNTPKATDSIIEDGDNTPRKVFSKENSKFPPRSSSLLASTLNTNAIPGDSSLCESERTIFSMKGVEEVEGKANGKLLIDEDIGPTYSSSATVKVNKDFEISAPRKAWTNISVPDPIKMPNTFTNAICHQQQLHIRPILTLTLKDTTPAMHLVTSKRNELLLHLEIGLDGVEAMCQGQFTIDESSYWKLNVREKRLGKLGTLKSGVGGHSKRLEEDQIQKGLGQGLWIFFGIRFKQSGKEKRKGKGGKWACFGIPLEACSGISCQSETAVIGGGSDGEGIEVAKTSVKVERMECRFSSGGIACMDLWQGAEEWEGGVWSKIKTAMANNGLAISFLTVMEEIVTNKMRRAGMNEENGPNANKGKRAEE